MAEIKEFRFVVTGMTCGGCEKGVTQALMGLPGVQVLTVDRTKGEARVTVEGGATSPERMIAAIQAAGRFQARLG